MPSMPGNSEMRRNRTPLPPAVRSGKTTLALLWAITLPSDVEMKTDLPLSKPVRARKRETSLISISIPAPQET
jgi:hypothetical protein